MTLHLLYPPLGTDTQHAKLDLVAVHGLNPRSRDDTAHAWDTWRTPSGPTGRLWLRDDLSKQIPHARIFLYEYNSTAVSGHSRATFIDKANGLLEAVRTERDNVAGPRPIIFVGHSMGGLLIKQALINARNNALYKHIKDSTYGLCFFATPHAGGDRSRVSLGRSMAKLAIRAGFKKGDNVIEVLKAGSMFSQTLSEQWRHQSADYDCVSFWGSLDEVVPRESAQLGLASDREAAIMLNATHGKVCKFGESPVDQANLRTVQNHIRALCQRALRKDIKTQKPHDESTTVHTTRYFLPLSKNKAFTGREDILNEVQGKFFGQAECSRIAILGLGGVGKTQIALQMAHWVKENHPGVSIFWISALSDASFEQGYMGIARQLSIPLVNDGIVDQKESVRSYLSSKEAQRWLLVVDNVDDENLFFQSSGKAGFHDYLPESDDGLLLLTTRSKAVANSVSGVDTVSVGVMAPSEARILLEEALLNRETARQYEHQATELLDLLDYLPLAITQAAAYLNQNCNVSIQRYVELFKGSELNRLALMKREFRERGQRKEPVMSTWLVSFHQISETDSVAAELLSFISCIEPRAIPKTILPVLRSEEDTEHAIGTLCGYGFLNQRKHGQVFDMHRLVHLAAIAWIESQGRLQEVIESAMESLASIFPPTDLEYREIWQQYLSHGLVLLQKAGTCNSESMALLLRKAGECLHQDRRFREAVKCLERALGWWSESTTAEATTQQWEIKGTLAVAYLDCRQSKRAIKILENVVQFYKETLPAEDHERLILEHELGRAYFSDRRIGEALHILEHVVKMKRETLAPEHPSRLTSESQLAMVFQSNGQTKEAIEILEDVVRIQKEIMPDDDYIRIVSQTCLAKCYIDIGRLKKAIEILEDAVRIQTKISQAEDYNRLAAEFNLANAHLSNRQMKEGIELLEYVVRIEREILPPEHHTRLCSEHSLGYGYLLDGQYERAVDILEDVVNIQKQVLPPDHDARISSEKWLQKARGSRYDVSSMVETALR